jgi:NitT/TauT family transport system substrate-binding protein
MALKTLFPILLGLLLMIGSSSSAEEIRVGTWKTAQTIQPFFYENFSAEKVSVFTFTNPADQKTALLAGSLDICGTTLAHAVHSASLDQPVVVVASLCNKSSALVVKKDGPVRKIPDLRGKKIGFVPGTMHEILLREALTRNGLNPETDVKLIRVDFFDMGMALAGGSIDAFLSGEPFPAMAVYQGYGRILDYPYYRGTIGTLNAAMLVKRETIEKQPGQVFRLVRVHARTTRHLQANKDIWLEKAVSFGTPLDVLHKAEPNMELAWDMDGAFVRAVRELGARMQALGIIRKQPDYDRLFDLSFVEKVRREK